jgi:hypothetical protein
MQRPSSENIKASGEFISGCFSPRKKYSIIFIRLMAFVMCISPYILYAQKDTILPNGTDGLTFTPRVADSTFLTDKKDLPPNEFEGTYATFKVGLAYIGDFTAYAQSKVFKQQMDSAGYNLIPTYKTRDFRILGSGRILKTKRIPGV